ncbi:hypothetical protein [Dyella amyloliquefaciens]|uniref:hypothetical protein n=1 Tax=Dyella amyloliquefaciens TaxID=1770545 RepID=UPI00102EA4D7|nr:hypothetical protein [Dyella amyloliquefaciens]
MNLKLKIVAACALASLAFTVPAAETPQHTSTVSAKAQNVDLVATVARQHQLDFIAAPIKSSSDLQSYLTLMPKALSPIEKLSPGAKRRFLASLVFNENGLVGYDYSDITAELPASDVYRLMSLFGAQRTVHLIDGLRVEGESDKVVEETSDMPMADHKDFRCVGGHNCAHYTSMICMSGC